MINNRNWKLKIWIEREGEKEKRHCIIRITTGRRCWRRQPRRNESHRPKSAAALCPGYPPPNFSLQPSMPVAGSLLQRLHQQSRHDADIRPYITTSIHTVGCESVCLTYLLTWCSYIILAWCSDQRKKIPKGKRLAMCR